MSDRGTVTSRWLRLLRWFGLARRARVYAADTVIVDMSEAIQLLDPDLGQFQTMLWSLQNRQLNSTRLLNNAIVWCEDERFPKVVPEVPLWGDWRWDEGPHFWLEDKLEPRVDHLYADFTPGSGLLPVKNPQRFRVGDLVRVKSENVQILDGFLHVSRAKGSMPPCFAEAGTPVVIIGSAWASS